MDWDDSNKYKNIDQLAQEIIQDVEALGLSFSEEPKTFNDIEAERISQDFLGGDEANYNIPVDGSVECSVSEDGFSAWLSFYPPSSGMKHIDMDLVRTELDRHGIVHGIAWDRIGEALLRCNLEQVKVDNVHIASGTEPVEERPKHYVLEQRLIQTPEIPTDDSGKVDYKNVTPYILVKKGETLGTVGEAQEGVAGITVKGSSVPAPKVSYESYKIGENIIEKDGYLYATIDGIFEHQKQTISVKDVLVVQANVDYHTGNIDFSGDVVILGEVREGFSITSGASIYTDKTLDASNVVCAADLYVKRGIIGRKQGRIQVGNKVHAKFVENCLIEAEGMVEISTSIIRSSIYSSKKITCYPKGVVIGGTFYAQEGFTAYQIGSDNAPRTEIYCGLDYHIMKKLEWIKEQSMRLALELQKIRDQIKGFSGAEKQKLLLTHQKILQAISKLNILSSELVFKLDKNEGATVEVTGYIYPGVYIEICHASYIIDKPLSKLRFYLDKVSGHIKTERITA